MNHYYNPVRTFQGYGCLSALYGLAKEVAKPDKNILLLIWNKDVITIPAFEEFCEKESERVVVRCFSASNPELEQLYQMYLEVKDENIGLIIAVGGGSVLDVGKALCLLCEKQISDMESLKNIIVSKEYGMPSCRWIGIPTTAGTGSEVTCWATVWDSQNNIKYSMDTQNNYAFAAIADTQLTNTLPLKLAVSSALDAVAHAAESYWAKASNSVSRAMALEAIRTIMGRMDELLVNPDGKEARDAMSKGSMLAGLAFSNTRTTACHSISYPLTMRYRIPHGTAVSLLLPPVFRLNYQSIPNAEELLSAVGVKNMDEFEERIISILSAAGYQTRLSAWGAKEEDISELTAHSITKGRADNNPVQLTSMVVHDILKNLL